MSLATDPNSRWPLENWFNYIWQKCLSFIAYNYYQNHNPFFMGTWLAVLAIAPRWGFPNSDQTLNIHPCNVNCYFLLFLFLFYYFDRFLIYVFLSRVPIIYEYSFTLPCVLAALLPCSGRNNLKKSCHATWQWIRSFTYCY